jgi:heat shock protein HtpX
MWEAIAANRRRSFVLILAMAVILIALGGAIGASVEPRFGSLIGVVIALVVWASLWVTALAGGDRILLSTVGAREIQKEDAPRLWNVVEEMCIASGLSTMPKVYIIDNDAPNAFAAGRKPEKACVAVTSGLLRRLNRDELQGVIAHEIGHIRNLDIRFMMIAAVMVGSVTLLADFFFRGMFYGRVRTGRRSGGGGGGGQAQLILILLAVAVAILAPLFARALYYACSRQREYLADASAARYTRYPLGLASALEKIAAGTGGLKKVNRVMPPMFIINPNQPMAASGWGSTHPPTEKRIQILRSMGGAGYSAYQAAWQAAEGEKGTLIGERSMAEGPDVAVREASPEAADKEDLIEASREVLDLLDRGAGFLLIPCVCGVRMKLPPEYTSDTITCARCGREHKVPHAEENEAGDGPGAGTGAGAEERAGGSSAEGSGPKPPPLMTRYRRKAQGWESFKCGCGQTLQLSPGFAAPSIECPQCGRKIEIES